MKKLISILSFLICALSAFGQTTPTTPAAPIQNLGAPTNIVDTRGTHAANMGFAWYGDFVDTTSANLTFAKNIAGMTIRTGNTWWYRDTSKTEWRSWGSGSLYVDTTQTIRLNGTGSLANPLQAHGIISQMNGNSIVSLPDGFFSQSFVQNGIISGGLIVFEQNLDYTVTAAEYAIANIRYSSDETGITLAAADPTFNRFDLVVVDVNGDVVVITGTASDDPQRPNYDAETQLPLSFILVTAASTEPAYCRDSIYYLNNGNTWTGAVSNAGRINLTSTNNPYSVAQDIEFTLARNGDQLRLTKATVVNLGTYSVLVLKIRSKAAWAATSRLVLRWYNVLTPLGIDVVIGNGIFGFNSSNTATYQTIVIPLSNFGSVTNPDNLLFTVSATGSNTIGLYADNIELLGCEGAPIPEVGNFHAQGGNRWGTTSVIGTLDNFNYQVKTNNTNHSLFQVGGSIQLQGATPRLSFQLGTGANSDYFHTRTGTDLITNTAGGYITRFTGNRVYSFDKNNGHLWADSLATLRMRLAPTGALRLDAYGDNTFTGTATRWLAVDVDGNVIEQAPPTGTVSASGGLSISSGTNVVLGGSALAANTSISTSAFSLTVNSSIPFGVAGSTFISNNSADGYAGQFVSTDGTALYAQSTNGNGIVVSTVDEGGIFVGTNSFGLSIASTSPSEPTIYATLTPSSTNTVVPIIRLTRNSSGTPANGIGQSIDFHTETTTSAQESNKIISKWTDATNATRTSEFSITGVNSGTTGTILTIAGDGSITVGAAYQGLGAGYLAVSNTGQVTWSAGGGGGGGDALTANPLSQFAATTSAQLAGVISDETGSGALVFGTSPTLTTPILGTPTSVTLTNATGLPVATGISGLGTGVATALAINTGSAGAFVLFNGALGTPTSGTVSTGVTLGDVTMNVTGTDATGDIYYRDAGGLLARLAIGTSGQLLRSSAGGLPEWFTSGGGTGTVTSITLTQPSSGFTVTNSGVAATTVGTFTFALNNDLLAVENLATTGIVRRTGTNTWTAGTLVGLTTEVTGTLPVANGGTGQTSYTNGQLLIGNTSGNTLTKATLTGTSNQINITNGAGSITISMAFNPTVQTLSDAATITWNVTNGGNGQVTLGSTGRTLSITNPVAGYTYTVRIIQGSGGSKTITTWPTGTRWTGGTTPTLSTTAGQMDIVSLYYDGSNYYGTFLPNMN